MSCCCPKCCFFTKKVTNVTNRALRKECFSDMCSHSSFFYWVIIVWIFLIVMSIGLYSALLVEILVLHDTKTSQMIMNIVIHVINGLFTFAALLNLPVRCRRLRDLYGRRIDVEDQPLSRKLTTILFPSGDPCFISQSTED